MQRLNYCALIANVPESLTDLLFKSAMIPSNIPLQHCRVLSALSASWIALMGFLK